VCPCPDNYEVSESGEPRLGSPGPSVGLLQRVTGCRSYTIGKPNPQMLWCAWHQMAEHYSSTHSLRLSESLFVGDSLSTDIRMALEHDIDCALVLSGTSTMSQLKHSPFTPNFVFDSIADMHIAYATKGLYRDPAGREASSFQLTSSQSAESFPPAGGGSGYRSFIFDMDGVIHRFGVPIPGGASLLSDLLADGIPFVILTNEDRYTNDALLERLHGILGGIQLDQQHLVTASNAAKAFFRKKLMRGWRGSVYVIGEEGLLSNLREAFEGYDDVCVITRQEELPAVAANIDFVVVGSVYAASEAGSQYITSLERACAYASAGARVICSCPDDYEVNEAGDVKLGSPGPTVAALEAVTGRSSYAVGKPNPQMLWAAWSQMLDHYRDQASGLELSEALFVGDSLDTDIRTALEHRIDCALVLSGTTNRERLAASPLTPTLVFDSVAEIRTARSQGELTRGGSR